MGIEDGDCDGVVVGFPEGAVEGSCVGTCQIGKKTDKNKAKIG